MQKPFKKYQATFLMVPWTAVEQAFDERSYPYPVIRKSRELRRIY